MCSWTSKSKKSIVRRLGFALICLIVLLLLSEGITRIYIVMTRGNIEEMKPSLVILGFYLNYFARSRLLEGRYFLKHLGWVVNQVGAQIAAKVVKDRMAESGRDDW